MNILIVSFVPSHVNNNIAGNTSHIYHMTKYLQNLGYKIYFLYIDTHIEKNDIADIEGMKKEWEYVEVIESTELLRGYKRKTYFDFAYTDNIGTLANIMCQKFSINMCICHYFVYSKVLEIIPNNILKVIDTHDVFTNRYKRFSKFLIPKEFFSLSKKYEKNYLNRADIIIARTDKEKDYFNKITNSNKSITLTYFNILQHFLDKEYNSLNTIGFIGSFNNLNLISILQFLNKFDKEYKKGKIKNIKIEIAGTILSKPEKVYKKFNLLSRIKLFLKCLNFKSFFNIFKPNLAKNFYKYIRYRDYLSVTGFVKNIDDFYKRVDLIVVPIIFGTGVNIKTGEALSYGVPILSTTNGMKGFASDAKEHNFVNIKNLVSHIKDIQNHPYKLQELSNSSKLIFLNYLQNFNININKLLSDKSINFPKVINPKVTIIICVFNNLQLTINCCKSILSNTFGIPYEVIIVDDASTDPEFNILNQYICNAKIIRNKNNIGYLKSCNLASDYAKGEYLLFLNNDTLVHKDWLKYILQTFELHKNAGIVGGKLLNEDGSIQEAGAYLCNISQAGQISLNNSPLYSCEYVRPTGYVSGACLCIPTELFFKVNKLDEIYGFGYSEDPDLCMKIRELGYEVYYQPKALVTHLGSQTFGKDQLAKNNLLIKNNNIFFTKWKNQLYKNFVTLSNNRHPSEFFWVRNNSRNKKTILCFDDLIPSIFHGGGRSSLCYLKSFLKMGLNVKFFPENILPSELDSLEKIQQMGIEVITPNSEINSFLDINGKYIDYVFLQRPHSHKYLNDLKKFTRAKILYYGHDLHFLRLKRSYEITNNKKDYDDYKMYKSIEFHLIKTVDTAFYPSIFEINYINKLLPTVNNVQLLNPLSYNNTKIDTLYNKLPNKKDNSILIVASDHSPHVKGLKWFIDKVWGKVLINNNRDIYLKVVGNINQAFNNADIKKLKSKNIIFLNTLSDQQLAAEYKLAKLAINPTNFGAGFITKVAEAIYHRLPIVTPSIGVESLPYDYTDLIYVANDPESFIKYIKFLLSPNYIYNESKAKSFIDNYFSQKIIIEQLKKVL